MEWIKQVTIIFEDTTPAHLRGAHNGIWKGVEMLLRSDNRTFYRVIQSKVTVDGRIAIEKNSIYTRDRLLHEESKFDPVTESEFFADCEKQRVELNGAYL